jgi:hypothetical protein
MILDNEQHKAFLLEVLNQIQVPGQYIELAYQVKQAVVNATVEAKQEG